MNLAEFRRNLWQEITLGKCLVIAGMALLTLISWEASIANSGLLGTSTLRESANTFYLFIIGAFLFAWGAKQAADSIATEINNGSWSFQKLSGSSPISLLIGKLFGSTSFAWFATACVSVDFWFNANANGGSESKEWIGTWLSLIIGGVFVHALSMATVLLASQQQQGNSKIRTNIYLIISFFVILFIVNGLDRFQMEHLFHAEYSDYRWLFFSVSSEAWFFLTLLYFTAWSLIGCWRLLRAELQYRDRPLLWLLFFFSTILVEGGNFQTITSTHKLTGHPAYWTGWLLFTAFYFFSALSDPQNPVQYKALLRNWQQNRLQEFFLRLPKWTIAFVFSWLFCISLSLQLWFSEEHMGWWNNQALSFLSLPALGFSLLRDLFAVITIKSIFQRRTGIFIAAYLATAYAAWPILCNAIMSDSLQSLCSPGPQAIATHPYYAFVYLAEALITGIMLKIRINLLSKNKH